MTAPTKPRPGGRKKTRGRDKPPPPHASVAPDEIAPAPTEKYTRPARQTVAERIEELGGIEWVCEMIQSHKGYTAMAAAAGCSIAAVRLWLDADTARSARAAAARRASADTADDLALERLEDPTIEVARAREIAAHLRWRAKTRDPAVYGDRTQVDARVEVTGRPIEELRREAEAIAARLGIALPVTGGDAPEG